MIQALINYQKEDAKLKKIEKTLAESEERKAAAIAKKYIEGVAESVNKLDDRAAELIAAYEAATSEQVKLKEQETEIAESLDSAADEKEVQFLIKKAEELVSKIKSLGSKASKILAEIQKVVKEYLDVKKKTTAAQAQYKENGEKYNALKASFKEEKESVEKELASLKEKVDPTLMERYLKKREGKIYPVVYAVNGNVCGACGMELSMSELNKLKNGEIIDCDQCGRLLYQEK